MRLLADVGGIAGVTATLNAISLPKDVIEEIGKILQQQSDRIEAKPFNEVNSTWFGDRFSAANLGDHIDLAHSYLANSILEAVASLQKAGEAVERFDREMEDADGNAHAAATRLLYQTQNAVNAMDFDSDTAPARSLRGPRS